MLKLCHKYINWFFFFKKKQADDLATLPIHTYSKTWILHSIVWYTQYTQLIITYLKFFPISFEYLYSVGFLSISVILACFPLNPLPILPMKHSPSFTFCLLLHIFYTGHFPQNIISSAACHKQTIPAWFGGLSHISGYSLFISNISLAQLLFSYLRKLQRINLERKVLVTLKQAIPENPLTNKFTVWVTWS